MQTLSSCLKIQDVACQYTRDYWHDVCCILQSLTMFSFFLMFQNGQ